MPFKANSDQYIANVLSYVRAMNNTDGFHKNIVRDARENLKTGNNTAL